MNDDRLNSNIARQVNDTHGNESSIHRHNVRLNIEGLEFEETQNRVKNQLEGIIGVHKVDMSAGQTYVDINHDEQTTAIEINNHLQNNGYKVTEII